MPAHKFVGKYYIQILLVQGPAHKFVGMFTYYRCSRFREQDELVNTFAKKMLPVFTQNSTGLQVVLHLPINSTPSQTLVDNVWIKIIWYCFVYINKIVLSLCSIILLTNLKSLIMNKFTTPEMVIEESKKFKSLKEFKSGNPIAYEWGRYHDIIKTLYQKPKVEFTFEQCRELVKQYPSRSKLGQQNKKLYKYVIEKGWLDYMLPKGEFGNTKKYTNDMLFQESRKYKTFGEFRKASPHMYHASYTRGLFPQMNLVRANQTPGPRKTDDEIMEQLRDYPTKGILKASNKALYSLAYSRGILLKVYGGEPRSVQIKYNAVQMMEMLPKFKNRGDVYKNNNRLYNQALKSGIIDVVFPKKQKQIFVLQNN